MGDSTKEKAILILVVVIFGSGLGLYVWNRIQGRDLAAPPQFDLSAYDNVAELKAIGNYLEGNILATKEPEPQIVIEAPAAPVVQVISPGYIYFHQLLAGATLLETKKMVSNFLQDFQLINKLSANVEYFGYLKNIEAELPLEKQEQVIGKLKSNKEIESVVTKENNSLQILFKSEKSFTEIENFLIGYPDVKLKTSLVRDPDYIARLSYGDRLPVASELEKLKLDFSDIVTVKE